MNALMTRVALSALVWSACVVQGEVMGNLCTNPCENTPCVNENFDGEKGTCLVAERTFALNTCVNETGTVPEFNVHFKAFSMSSNETTVDTFVFRLFDHPLCPNDSIVYHATVNRIDCGVIGNMTLNGANATVFRAVALLDTDTDWVFECDSESMATWKIVVIVIGSLLALALIAMVIVRGRRQVGAYEAIR